MANSKDIFDAVNTAATKICEPFDPSTLPDNDVAKRLDARYARMSLDLLERAIPVLQTRCAEQRDRAVGGQRGACPACGGEMVTPKPFCLNCISKEPRVTLPETSESDMSEAQVEFFHDFQRETGSNYCSDCGVALRPDKAASGG